MFVLTLDAVIGYGQLISQINIKPHEYSEWRSEIHPLTHASCTTEVFLRNAS